MPSDKWRYEAVSVHTAWLFTCCAVFLFSPPQNLFSHSCQVFKSSKASRKHATTKKIAVNPPVRDMAISSGGKVTHVIIQRKLKNEGIFCHVYELFSRTRKVEA